MSDKNPTIAHYLQSLSSALRWGYTGEDYSEFYFFLMVVIVISSCFSAFTGCKLGDQMIAVKKMLDRVAGIMA